MQHVTAIIDLSGSDTEQSLATVTSVLEQTRACDDIILRTHGIDEEPLGRIHNAFIDADRSFSEGELPTEGWLWFINDTLRAEHDALEKLCDTVEVSPSVALAGAKQVRDDAPRELIDVGLSVDKTGYPLAMIEPGEIDQGQYDSVSDVFSVATTGMLIRADVFGDLNGFDTAVPDATAVDTGWRTRLAGYRVVVVPAAVIRHFESSPRLSSNIKTETQAATWLNLKHRTALSLPFAWLGTFFSALGVLIGALVLKDPARGAARASGKLSVAAHPGKLAKARSQASKTRVQPYSVVDSLRIDSSVVRDFRRTLFAREETAVIGDGTGADEELQPTGDDDEFTALATPQRSWVGTGAIISILVLAAVAVIGFRSLLNAEALTGGNLTPASTSLSELFTAAASGYNDVGAGVAGYGGFFGWILVFFGLFGASTALKVLILTALPLAGLTGWLASGEFTRNRTVRFVLSLLWGFAPVLLISVSDGRIGAVIVHLLLPLAAIAVSRVIKGSLTAAGWLAILFAIMTAAAPSLLIPGIVLIAIFALASRTKHLWWTPVLAIAMAVPEIITSWRNPRAIFADPGAPSGYLPGNPLEFILGFPNSVLYDTGLDALPWLDSLAQIPWSLIALVLIGAPMVLAAVAGIFTRHGAVTLGLLASLIGVATGFIAARFYYGVDANGTPVAIFTGPAVSLVWLGLFTAACYGATAAAKRKWGAPITVLGLISAVIAGGLWLTPRVASSDALTEARNTALIDRASSGQEYLEPLTGVNSLRATPQAQLPATAVDRAESPLRSRTLVIQRSSEGFNSKVVNGSGSYLEDLTGVVTSRGLTGSLLNPQSAGTDAASDSIRTATASLVTGTSADLREEMNNLGVSFVLLVDNQDAGEISTAAQIDAVTGMTPVGLTDFGWLWRVTPEDETGAEVLYESGPAQPQGTNAAAYRIDADGSPEYLVAGDTVTVPASDAEERTLVLAHRKDGGWHATFDGDELQSTDIGWNQAFELPSEQGELEISYRSPISVWYWVVPGVLFIAALIIGIPTPRRKEVTRG